MCQLDRSVSDLERAGCVEDIVQRFNIDEVQAMHRRRQVTSRQIGKHASLDHHCGLAPTASEKFSLWILGSNH